MKNLLIFALIVSTSTVWAKKKKGPTPHERTDTSKLKNATAGRYIYLGDVPKFDGEELELTISKMNLTTRVTAYVDQERIDGYANQLFLRWKSINDAQTDSAFSFHPLVKLSDLAQNQTAGTKAWIKIAEQYSTHILEKSGVNVYADKRNAANFESLQAEDEYKNKISEAYFKMLFDTNESPDDVINDNAKLENLLSSSNSARLFSKHMGHLYTKDSGRKGYLGYLTFVYPIAATVDGPFTQPKESTTDLKTAQSIEARWWSDKWQDEFGGFPFLLLEWSGVAFHGPISNYSALNVWFLRRGYVSHGCHRMDASDVLELRTLMPHDLKKAANKINVTILDHFDVVDWDKDGTEEVMDVKYYNIPATIAVGKGKSIDDVIKPFLVENQQKSFINNNSFAKKFYDSASDTLKGIPRYSIDKKSVKKVGTYESVGIKRFEYRPSRVIQYTEDNLKLTGFDDNSGKYPPKYFQRY